MDALETALPRDIRAVLIDDHALMRDGTVQILERTSDIHVAGQAGTAEEGLALIEDLHPDVAVIDINLPGMNGLDLARIVRSNHPRVGILVLSAHDDYAYVAAALDIGVGGYLLKTVSASELVDSVRAVADGVFVLDRSISQRLAGGWRKSNNGVPEQALTARENAVLDLLAWGWPNKRIASELGLGVRTVEGHVSKVLAKLGLKSRAQAVRYALDHHLIKSGSLIE